MSNRDHILRMQQLPKASLDLIWLVDIQLNKLTRAVASQFIIMETLISGWFVCLFVFVNFTVVIIQLATPRS